MLPIEKAIDAEDWAKARKLIKAELTKEPDDRWLITRLSLTYYEQKQYGRALTYSRKAYAIAPNCPLVLWDYAGDLEMLGRVSQAMIIYQKIIRRGVQRIAYGECGEGLRWARGLICDCHYRLAHCFLRKKNRSSARKHFKKHLAMRGTGSRSIYPLAAIRGEMHALNKPV